MKSLAGAVGSAILLALFARLDARLAWLGWFALVPLMALPATTLWQAVAQGYVLTTLFTVGVFGWFASAIADYTHQPQKLAWVALAALAPLVQPQFLVFTLTRYVSRSVTTAVCAWIATEWLYPKPLGDTLGYGMHPIPEIRQCADLAGVALITLAMLTTSAVLARFTKRSIVIAAAIIAAMVVYGSVQAPDTGTPLTVGLIQANLVDYDELKEQGTYAAADTILTTHEMLSEDAISRGAELIVWPETVYPTTFGTAKSEAQNDFDRRIRRFPKPLIFGTYDTDGTREYNAAVVLPSGQVYRKQRLFPYTERAWGRGHETVVADGIAPLICYDVTDASLARTAAQNGARLLVTLSNDSWLHHGLGPQWHLVVAAFRSVETHLPQARATTDGISAFIDAHGNIQAQTRERAREILVGTVVMPHSGTVPQQGLEPAITAVGIVWMITGAIRRRRRRTPRAHPS